MSVIRRNAHSRLWAEHALLPQGWASQVAIELDTAGKIAAVAVGEPSDSSRDTHRCGILLPAVANLHSHAFQRAMAGMTETRGPDPQDSFWTWRKLMYRFLDQLDPDTMEAIAAFGQIEMLESGYASVGEFHYLHHQADGSRYASLAEMSERIVAASQQSGIGLTLLPVLYQQGGCDGRALSDGQKRFGNSIEQYERLYDDAKTMVTKELNDATVGVAPHSLRAVSEQGLKEVVLLAEDRPVHVHIAEQTAEIDEFQSTWNARPVEWLLDNHAVSRDWCLVHATHMLPDETLALAKSGAVAGLCPITESNLGDGIFDGASFHTHQGHFGIGTDSNIRISLSEELRTLEYSQRLRDRSRAIYADTDRSTGRVLFESALAGGAQALQRASGAIKVGNFADLLTLNKAATPFAAVSHDGWLDAWIFAADDSLVSDVWSAGRHVVKAGRHCRRDEIEQRYVKVLNALTASL
ncbi:MAG: formimidoylglutamate deiminase [Granulosicoccus sp.]|nr:formimidoylglutamate deiminase [Granulosicoccus sp.]